MSRAVRVMLPEDVADELVDEGIAVPAFATRGELTGEVLRIVIDSVNTGASLVTIVTAPSVVMGLAKRVRQRLDRNKRNVRISVTGPGGSRNLVFPPDAEVERFDEELASALHQVLLDEELGRS
jgi:hypothetical protein